MSDFKRDFTINAALTKAFTRKATVNGAEVEQMVLSGIASSTVRDRHGDTITARGQASMLTKLQTGNNGAPLAMFLNHSYNVPEDVLGHCGESQLVTAKGADGEGDVIDLEIICVVTPENPRAVMAWKIVNSGVPLGYSIGGAITECSVDEENDDGESWCPPLLIDGLDLFEISLCGIPANPRSYTDATKSLVKDLGLAEDAPEPTKDWARAMRLGFVRSATRNAEVRKQLRAALPALQEAAAPAMVALACTECDWKRDAMVEDADAIVREHEDDQAHVVERNEIAPETKDADDADDALPAKAQATVAECIGHLAAAMAHGACDDVMDAVKKAHAGMSAMLAPADGDDPEDEPNDGGDPDDVQNAAPTGEATVDAATVIAGVDVATFIATLGLDPTATAADVVAALEAKFAAATAAATQLAATTEQLATRTAELADAEAKRDAIKTEVADLQKRADDLGALPAGRANAGTSATTAASRPQTMYEAQRALGAALTGASASNPTIRPE